MTVTPTYDNQLSRVRVAFDTPNALTASINVERSTNGGITYTMVRGGQGVEHTEAEDGNVVANDYEFVPGVVNRYRVQFFSAAGALLGGQFSDITPTITAVWLKVPARPFLNRTIELTGLEPEFSRPSKHGVFEVLDRSLPVVVTAVPGSRRYTVAVRVDDPSERRDFDLLLSTGEILYIQVPHDAVNCPVSTMYVTPEAMSNVRFSPALQWYVFTLGLIESAPPGPDIVGATVTWQSVVNTFATWADVVAAEASWYTLNERIGTPDDVIVP